MIGLWSQLFSDAKETDALQPLHMLLQRGTWIFLRKEWEVCRDCGLSALVKRYQPQNGYIDAG